MAGEGAEGPSLGPDDAASVEPTNSADSGRSKIQELLGEVLGGVLSGDLDEDRVLDSFAEVEILFAQLSEEDQAIFGALFTMQQEQILGFLKDKDPDRHEEAVGHFAASLKAAEEASDELGPVAGDDVKATLSNNVVGARLTLARSKLWTATGDERERLQKEVDMLAPRLVGSFVKAMGALMRQLAEAIPLFMEATRLLGEMDLERAAETMSRAGEKFGSPETLLAKIESEAQEELPALADLIQRYGQFYTGFNKLIEATQLYIEAHRDAVLGNAQQAHVKQLDRAESLIDEAWPELEQGGLALSGIVGSTHDLDIEGFESALNALRKNVINLRRLVTAALLPKQQARNAAPLLVLLFLITLVFSLLGLRLSGLVDDLGGVELLAIVGFSVVISFGGTFGATVGLSALSTVGRLFGKGKGSAAGGGESR